MRGMKIAAIAGKIKTLAALGVIVALAIAPASAQPSQPSLCSFYRERLHQILDNTQRIVIAIDTSPYAEPPKFNIDKLSLEKDCAAVIVQTLAGKEFAILSFNSSVTIVQEPTTSTSALIDTIKRIQSTNTPNKNVAAAIEASCRLVQPISPRGALVLLTADRPTPLGAARQAAENFKATCSPTLAVIDVGIAQCLLRGLASPGAYFSASPIIVDTFTLVIFRSAASQEIDLPAPPSNGILVRSQTPWVIQEARWLKDNAPFGNPIAELEGQTVTSFIEIGFLKRFGEVSLDGRMVKLSRPQGAVGLEIRALQEWVIQAAAWTEDGFICDEIRGLQDQLVQYIRVMTF